MIPPDLYPVYGPGYNMGCSTCLTEVSDTDIAFCTNCGEFTEIVDLDVARLAAEPDDLDLYDYESVPTVEQMAVQLRMVSGRRWVQGPTPEVLAFVNKPTVSVHTPGVRELDSYIDSYPIGQFRRPNDVWFIIMARQFVPWAIKEIERLRAEVAKHRQDPNPDES